jgi:uncharacterized protein YbjT (DUF2867 family)
MILITGGRGAIATHLRNLLLDNGFPIRVASAHPTEPDVVPLDLTDPATFAPALDGVTSVFLYASAAHIGEFVDVAVAAGVAHVVLLSSASVLGPNADADPLAASHHDVERALLASPITTTILRPGSFASNAASWAWPIKAGRPVSLPFPGAYTAPIHERDIAEAAFAVFTEPAHQGGVFTLTGPATITFTEHIDQLAKVIGRSIAVEHVSRDEWKTRMSAHVTERFADAILDLWESNDGRPGLVTDTVEALTGHPARSFEDWAVDHRALYT